MKNLFKKIFVPLAIFTMAIGTAISLNDHSGELGAKAAENTVTYSISAKNTLTVSGVVPAGTSATIVETYSTSKQMTSGNSQTLTLKGFGDKKITNLTLSMKSNSSGGAGNLIYRLGSGSDVTVVSTNTFSNAAWNGKWSSTYVDISKPVDINVSANTDLFIKLSATANSLYCESYSITYLSGPSIALNKDSVDMIINSQTTISVISSGFTPTSYSWTKEDPNSIITLSNTNTSIVTVHSAMIIGQATISVEVSDDVNTLSMQIDVNVMELKEGSYSISVADTTYSDPLDTNNLIITKTDSQMNALFFSNIDNVRLNSSPNENKTITIGRNNTTGGKFTISLPEGLYATSIRFNGLMVDSGKTPTLSINNGVRFTYSGSTTETLHPYANSLEISTLGTSRIWTSSIEITAKKIENAALDFGTYLLNKTDAECANLSVLTTTWNELSTIYSAADTAIKDIIQSTAVDNAGNELEKALGRYEYIRAKYGYSDFILGGASPIIHRDNMNKSNDNMMLISLISIIGLSSLVGYYFMNKKKKLD